MEENNYFKHFKTFSFKGFKELYGEKNVKIP